MTANSDYNNNIMRRLDTIATMASLTCCEERVDNEDETTPQTMSAMVMAANN